MTDGPMNDTVTLVTDRPGFVPLWRDALDKQMASLEAAPKDAPPPKELPLPPAPMCGGSGAIESVSRVRSTRVCVNSVEASDCDIRITVMANTKIQ